jgi:hypothetical protein
MNLPLAVADLELIQGPQLDQPVDVGFVHSGPIGQLRER